MQIVSSYSVGIKNHNGIFTKTLKIYRMAVDFIIDVCLAEWDDIEAEGTKKERCNLIESLIHKTEDNPNPKYAFDDVKEFYKMPSYLRRAAASDALGLVSSYKSNAKHNTNTKRPKAGFAFPSLYKKGMYKRIDDYHAKIKVFTRNTWDWVTVRLDKSDADYIIKNCHGRKECAPYLVKRGKCWFLSFAFEENVTLNDVPLASRRIASVDLGINNACVVSVMTSEGTVIGRRFLRLPIEKDSLEHALSRIKKAQQHGARKMPRLWAKAKGINKDITIKTARFIMDVAHEFGVHVIVFEHLDLDGKKRGAKKQRLHLWKARDVQTMVTHKAHRMGMHVSRVNAWNTSRLAYDGSGRVERDKNNYSMCTFKTGKRYHADLSASYNIGARYFIREILKSVPETVRLECEAKVPHISKRSTCTLSDLINLDAELTRLRVSV